MSKLHIILKKENCSIRNLIPYSLSFFITICILFLFYTYYNTGHGNPLANALSIGNILLNGIASTCALFYLKHTKAFCQSTLIEQLLLSISYGLCSYGIVQENLLSALLLYALFPLVFLSYEKMIIEKTYRLFIFAMAIALIIHPAGTLPIFLLFIILCLIDLILQRELSLGNYIHIVSCFALAFLLGAFRIFPYLDSLYPISYSGYSTSYPFFMLLSRFLPFGSISISLGTDYGIDVYTGLFLLILIFVFFVSKKIATAKKIAYGFFLLLIYGTITISPLRFLFSLFTENNRYSVFFSFFIVFWFFRLASEALSVVKELSVGHIVIVYILSMLYTLVCFVSFRHNFVNYAFPVMFIAITIYCALLFFTQKKGKAFSFSMFGILLLFLGEMTANTLVSTNLNFYPGKRSIEADYIWEELKSSTTPITTNIQETELEDINAYANFLSEHQNNDDLELFSLLLETVTLEDSEYESLCDTAFPNYFEKINGAAKKLGCTDTIFTPTSISTNFETSKNYSLSNMSDNLYYFYGDQSETRTMYHVVPFEIIADTNMNGDLYLHNSFTGDIFSYSKEQLADTQKAYTFFINQKGYGTSFYITSYILNRDALQTISSMLENCTPSSNIKETNFTLVYTGITISCIGLLICFILFFNSDKEKVYAFLSKQKEKISCWKFPMKLCLHIKYHYVYYLAFIVPVFVFLVSLLVNDCIPFGENSFFSGDGTALTLPSYWDCYHNLKIGNKYMSLNGGYGTNQYASHPFIGLLSFFCFFEANQIPTLLLLTEALCLGACGLTMVFYLTHRINGKTAKKTDYRLLAAAFIYSLNAYMIAMHDFTSWYFVLLAFPLLMLAFEWMIYKRKTLPYVLLLTFCISANLYLALYMCIFLVIYFFTCHFKGTKDFLLKGIRFGLCSILAAGNSFLIIANTLFSSADSLYRESDSVFPTFGLHTNFLEQWKQQMIFSVSHSVSTNEGMANLYYGITTIFFLLIFIFSKKHLWRDKLRKIVPIIVLYISFNEQVLSYLWNGFHYQSNVPNRFVFLLMFLVAIMAYDGICEIRKISAKKLIGITLCICGFILTCKLGTDKTEALSFVVSLCICLLFLILLLLFGKRKPLWKTKSILILLTLELCANTIYSFSNIGVNTIMLYGDYNKTISVINGLEENKEYFRTTFPASVNALTNSGGVLDTNTTDLFNSFVTAHQNNLNTLLGFYSNGNIVNNENNSTPFGLSLAGVRYIFLPNRTKHSIHTLSLYPYLGANDIFYVFENPNALSLGFYVPNEMLNLDVSVDNPTKFSNDFVSTYLKEPVELLQQQQIEYSSDTSTENSFIFTDAYGNPLEVDKAYEMYSDHSDEANISDLHMQIQFTPTIEGSSYLYANEYVGIGTALANETKTYNIAFPNMICDFDSIYEVVTLDQKLLNRFCDTVKQNQMENITVGNDTITGTTNYMEDGYTMLSLAYDKGWHAYIDGEEVPIEDPYNAMMFIKTPKGKHTITLKYIPYGMNFGRTVSLIFVGITILIYGFIAYKKHSSKKN